MFTYLETEKLNSEVIYYETASEQKQALLDGEVDVISGVSLSPIANTRIVAQFAPRPYYFASTKGNTELIRQLDETIAKINQVEPKLQDTLYDHYFRTIDDAFSVTETQQQTLAGLDTLNVLCIDNEDRTQAREYLTNGSYDMLIGAPLTSSTCAELGFINSAPVIQSVLAYVQNPTSSGSGTIAVMSGIEELINTEGYDNTLIFDNTNECIQAVESKKADLAAGDRSVMEYYIYDNGSTLVTSLIPGQTQNVSITVSRECDAALLTVLNNYIYSISEADLAAYLSRGNLHSDSFSLLLFTRRHPAQAILAVIVVMAVLAQVIFLPANRAAKQRVAMQEQHNTQLKEALQIAREANESKTTFLSNMSHDIRTTMNAVIGFSTLLAKEPDNGVKVREYSRKVTAASSHLLGLINDILDISKIESGKVSLHQSVFSIQELIESINVVVRPMAGAKKQDFRVHMDTMQHELFVGDKVRISQVLINLLSNAVKYTPLDGHITFTITDMGSSSSSFERIQFRISDDGYGITEEFQKVIFETFTRAESSMVNKEVGTGLGLAITKNIVDLMGGTIELQSAVNMGSTFTVELPLRIPHEEEDEHFWENHNMSHLLLVDDDKDVCDGIRSNMEDTGVQFDAAYSGETAVELVKREYMQSTMNTAPSFSTGRCRA